MQGVLVYSKHLDGIVSRQPWDAPIYAKALSIFDPFAWPAYLSLARLGTFFCFFDAVTAVICAPSLCLSSFESKVLYPHLAALDHPGSFFLAAQFPDRRLFRHAPANISSPSSVSLPFQIHNSSFISTACILPHAVSRSSPRSPALL